MDHKIEGIRMTVLDEDNVEIGTAEVKFIERITLNDSYDGNAVKLASLKFLREIKTLIEKHETVS